MAGNNSHASGAAGLNRFVGLSLSLACEEKRRATSPDMKRLFSPRDEGWFRVSQVVAIRNAGTIAQLFTGTAARATN
jgi:hypothetical protein